MHAIVSPYQFLLLIVGLPVPAVSRRSQGEASNLQSLALGATAEGQDELVQQGYAPLPDWRPRSPIREHTLQATRATVLAETGLPTPTRNQDMINAERALADGICSKQDKHPGDPSRYWFFEDGVLGKGSYGTVYVAAEKASKQVVAVKSIGPPNNFQELELIPSIFQAPFLATVNEVFLDKDAARIVMPLYMGKTLYHALGRARQNLDAEDRASRQEITRATEELAEAEKVLQDRKASWGHLLKKVIGQQADANATVETLEELVAAKSQSLEVLQALPSRVMAEWHAASKRLLAQIAYGLWEMHQRGMIHIDLKLENTALDGVGEARAVIIDFGLAEMGCPLDGSPCCQTRFMTGTAVYSAAYTCQAHFSFEMDFVSWAVMAFEILSGRPLRCPWYDKRNPNCVNVRECWRYVKESFLRWMSPCRGDHQPTSRSCQAQADPLVPLIETILLDVAESSSTRREWAKLLSSPRPEEHPVLRHYQSFGLQEEFGEDLREGWHAFCQKLSPDLQGNCRAPDDEKHRSLDIDVPGLCPSGAQNPRITVNLEKRMGASRPSC